ncbi:hypothetical protein [Peptoniphilus grossensis]|uniref:hypothetical protein n=1 Tax=Peptoniphilus grossensis TaxID=1465756 RepID=UPI00031246F9|nr:hypothetical protein [Peptoniphilus grossensis]
MIKAILYYENNTLGYGALPRQEILVKNEEEFWEKYNSSNEYVKCEDALKGAYSVYLKKDKIIEIWIEKIIEEQEG